MYSICSWSEIYQPNVVLAVAVKNLTMHDNNSTTVADPALSSLINDINSLDGEYVLVAHNNSHTTFIDVIKVLSNEIPCSLEKAAWFANSIHTQGKCEVMEDSWSNCFRVQQALLEIKVDSDIISL